MNDIDQLHQRIDREGKYYAMLAKRVATVERQLDHLAAKEIAEKFPQEYVVKADRTFTGYATEQAIRTAADQFVAALGSANRTIMRESLDHSHKRGGDALRQLRNALARVGA